VQITNDTIKFIQTELNNRYNLTLNVDGDAGEKTQIALMKVPSLPTEWDLDRKLIGFLQLVATLEGLNAGSIDGRLGPQTEQAYEDLRMKKRHGSDFVQPPWRKEEFLGENYGIWPLQNQSELNRFYGDVGTHQSKANSPYPLKLAWATDKIINSFTCHEKVKHSIERVLQKVLDHYGLAKIQQLGLDLWGGCLNVRDMRGGTTPSTHSWGIAIDWDPIRNKLKWKKEEANFAKSEYDFWWKCWEEEGWVSLGRTKNYDWMHVQACRVK
jgi:hypothetical protein